MIIVDSNEPADIVAELQMAGIEVEIAQLRPAADYIVGRFAIERKSNTDFYSSIYNSRLFSQLKRLNDMEEYKPLLAVHGPIPCTHKWIRIRGRPVKASLSNDDKAKRERTAMAAFSTTINSYDRMSLVTFKSQEQFVKFIIDLHYRQTQKAKRPVHKKKADSIKDVKWNIMSQLPGIGSKGATTLANSELSIVELGQLSPKELQKMFEGIGPKRAELIHTVLNT